MSSECLTYVKFTSCVEGVDKCLLKVYKKYTRATSIIVVLVFFAIFFECVFAFR